MNKGVLSKEDEVKFLGAFNAIPEKIDREVSLSWDGKNLLIRLPKDIAEYLGVNDKNRFKKKIKFVIEEKGGVVIKTFDAVDRTEPKRETK